MNTFWEKFKFWTKITVSSLIALYVIIFFLMNSDATIHPGLHLLFVNKQDPNAIWVLLITAVGSVFSWWLLKLVYRAVRQLRHMRERSRTERLERDVAEMKTKAQTLQTKPLTAETPKT